MNRRQFFGLAASSIFVPVYGKWYRQGSGVLVPPAPRLEVIDEDVFEGFEVGSVYVADGQGNCWWQPLPVAHRGPPRQSTVMRITAMDAETMTLEAPSAPVSHDLWRGGIQGASRP